MRVASIAVAGEPPAEVRPEAPRPAAATRAMPQTALAKLGLPRDIDLALHLPLRYEDETRVVAIAALRDGSTAQVEGLISDCRVEFRPRRQLVVRLDDGSQELVLRFLHFYPSHQKSLAPGRRVRARGDVRGGLLGLEMVHPSFKVVDADTPLPSVLTPVYPASAQLPQAYLRKAVLGGLARADLSECLPADLIPTGTPSLRSALTLLHQPGADVSAAALEDRSQPAWRRLKFDELVAQQLSQAQARRARERQRAPTFTLRDGGLQQQLVAALPFRLTAAQRRVCDDADRLAVRADGADRNPRRTAFTQARRLAGAARHQGRMADRQPQG